MANTILEKLQEKYPNFADDARNIAEALGMINGTGGRGSGAIADVMNKYITVTLDPNGGEGDAIDESAVSAGYYKFPSCPFTPPEGKIFDYWNTASTGEASHKLYPNDLAKVTVDLTLYAIWKDAE